MNIRACAFTDRGAAWEKRLPFPVDRPESVREWTKAHFAGADALLFIGACGIAVRAVAPHIVSKLSDPAVLVMDEKGEHVISLLSGHLGGANALCLQIARLTGARPVITTATDLNRLPAVDVWAKENDCAIENPENIKRVSAAVLRHDEVGVMITERALTPPFPATLVLRPRTLYLGAGCKKNAEPAAFERAALAFLDLCGVSVLSVKALCSIDLKKEEAAMTVFAARYGVPFFTFSKEELLPLEGVFSVSEYVKKVTGVDCVCERAAKRAGGQRMLRGKTVLDGNTFSLWGDNNT